MSQMRIRDSSEISYNDIRERITMNLTTCRWILNRMAQLSLLGAGVGVEVSVKDTTSNYFNRETQWSVMLWCCRHLLLAILTPRIVSFPPTVYVHLIYCKHFIHSTHVLFDHSDRCPWLYRCRQLYFPFIFPRMLMWSTSVIKAYNFVLRLNW